MNQREAKKLSQGLVVQAGPLFQQMDPLLSINLVVQKKNENEHVEFSVSVSDIHLGSVTYQAGEWGEFKCKV